MKKKNLLALSALVLSLGLTVSSCAGAEGPKGDDGEKGDQGETGPQGPQGEAGQDGKTYIDIIVSKVEGGTIKQDKWAVTEGENETVTFTFVPDDESTDLVIDIEVNGVVLPDVVEPNEDGELQWSLVVDQNYQSVQLRAAKFTNADSYGKDQINAYYKSLVEKDNQLAFAYEDTEDEPDHGQWWNTSVQTVVATEQAKVSAALADLEDDATAKEKLEAVKPVVEAAKTAIDEAYSKAVIETKEKAIEALDDLSKSVKSDNYKDEDSSKILTDAKTAVNAATSIEEITALVNETPVGDSETIGSYNQLYADKKAAFSAVEGALESVLDKEDGLDKDDKNYQDLVDALKLYGVTVESFPTEVAQTWLDKISAATSFEKYTEDSAAGAEMSYKKGDIKDAVEGAYAVTECLESVKSTLVENIRKQYVDEVDNSKVMTDSNARTTAKSTINNAIDNWLNANKTASLISYTSSDVSSLTINTQSLDSVSKAAKKENITKVGLIAWIELNVATIDNTPFQTERVQNASASAKKNLEAHVKEIKDGDSDYSKAISWTEVPATATSHAGEYKVNTKIGQKDFEVYNPFVTGAKDIKEDNKAYYAKEDALLTQYSVDSTLESYVNEDGEPLVIDQNGKVDSDSTAVATVLGLKNWEENGLTGLNKTYDDARVLYRNTVKGDITTELENVEGSSSLTSAFDKLFGTGINLPTTNKDFTMNDVSLSRKSISTASTVLFDEDTGLQAVLDSFISTMNSDDHDYALVLKADSNPSVSSSTTEVGKAFKEVFNGVVAGTMTTDDVEDFADDLESLYATDVANRKAFLLNTLEIQASNLITASAGDAEGLTHIATINARLAEAKAALNDTAKYSSKLTAYSENTYTAVSQWYTDSLEWINAYEDTGGIKNVGDLGLVASDEDVSTYLTGKVSEVSKSVIYNTEGEEISAWETVRGLLDDISTTNLSVEINVEQGDLDISSAFDKLNAKVELDKTSKKATLTYEGFETVSDVNEYVEDVLVIKEAIREIANDRIAENAIKGDGTIKGVEGVSAAQEIIQGDYTFNNDSKLTATVDSNGVINLSGDISETKLGTGTSAAAIFPGESADTPTFTVVVEFDQEGGETLRSTWLKSTTADTSKLEVTENSLTGWKTANIEGDEGKHIYCCALLDEYKVNHVLRVEVLGKDSKVVRTITIDIAQLFEDSGLNA